VEPKLWDRMLRQLPFRSFVLRGRVGVGETMPCSRSSVSEMGIGRAEDEDVFTVSAARTWMSSSESSWYASYLGLEGEPRARERTTSPLQMGHVRRRVVSHGVLDSQLIWFFEGSGGQLTCSPRGTRDHMVDS